MSTLWESAHEKDKEEEINGTIRKKKIYVENGRDESLNFLVPVWVFSKRKRFDLLELVEKKRAQVLWAAVKGSDLGKQKKEKAGFCGDRFVSEEERVSCCWFMSKGERAGAGKQPHKAPNSAFPKQTVDLEETWANLAQFDSMVVGM
ncbi:PREDICTED: uncharacterized protein LOC108661967 [Theobroma cacao]|uniref:Uncharacterized protein LOC108661967 n=1 Tax=Theobroma cacao TaxID=3641 RepID=A0AB32WF16_THECC|nr:PREDICTED: uncharacterized protein LOC108661967 [Theobroma cacao]